MGTIHVTERDGRHVDVDGQEGETLMRILQARDMVRGECGGLKICSTCHVYIDADWYAVTGPAPPDEVDLIDGTLNYRAGASRLACQIAFTPALDGLKLTLGPEI